MSTPRSGPVAGAGLVTILAVGGAAVLAGCGVHAVASGHLLPGVALLLLSGPFAARAHLGER